MKKLFKVLLVVLLFLGVTGCKPVVNERLEAREVGDLLIEAYSEFFTVVERKAIPEELEHLVLDCIVLEGYYESGERTDGIVVIIEPKDTSSNGGSSRGGSSTHTSSSGRSHGGGGRRL